MSSEINIPKVNLPVGSILQFALVGGIIIGGIILIKKGSEALSGSNFLGGILGNAKAESQTDKQQGNQQSDQKAQQDRAQAELDRAEAELERIEGEIARAESEGKRAEAEDLRAEAELLRAKAELLRAQTEDRKVTNKSGLPKTEKDSEKQQTVLSAQEIADRTKDDDSTKSPKLEEGFVEVVRTSGRNKGKTVKVSPENVNSLLGRGFALPSDVTIADNQISVNNSTPEQQAISNIQGSKKSKKPRASFFDEGSVSQITVVDKTGQAKITGGGSATNNVEFSIMEKEPETLSEVLRKFPSFTASQARDYLNRRGTFASESDRKAFESFDFGTNTGSGQKIPTTNKGGETREQTGEDPRERASKTKRQLEIEKAEKIRDRLIAQAQSQGVKTNRSKT